MVFRFEFMNCNSVIIFFFVLLGLLLLLCLSYDVLICFLSDTDKFIWSKCGDISSVVLLIKSVAHVDHVFIIESYAEIV